MEVELALLVLTHHHSLQTATGSAGADTSSLTADSN
jgi:hypothetical protein